MYKRQTAISPETRATALLIPEAAPCSLSLAWAITAAVRGTTISAVSNLSGYCFNRNGKLMIFSVLMGSVSDLSLAHAEQDLIAAEIASY